jgi:PAS domain S-box-containing protein
MDLADSQPSLEKRLSDIEGEFLRMQAAESQLAKTRKLFDLVAENIADMLAVIDPQGNRIWNNKAYTTTLGYTAEELEGSYSLSEIHPDDQPLVKEVFDEAMLTGVGRSIDYRIRHKQGHWVEIESTSRVVTNEEGHVECLVLMARDVTGRNRKSEQLMRSREVESAIAAASEIALKFDAKLAEVSHELIELRKVLPGQLKILPQLAEAEDRLREAQQLANNLTGLVTDESPREVVEPYPLIMDVIKQTPSGALARYDVRLKQNMPLVRVDVKGFSTALKELLRNAIEAAEIRSVIQITSRTSAFEKNSPHRPASLEPGTYLCIEILDQGKGMTAEELKSAFDPYFTTKKGHLGLGLAKALAMISRHQGTILLNTASAGTTARMFVPVCVSAKDAKAPPRKTPAAGADNPMQLDEPQKAQVGPLHILLMDDDHLLRQFVRPMLQELGHSVVEAKDGEEAIQHFEMAHLSGTNKFDLLLMDLVVPGAMGGAEAMQAIKQIDANAIGIASSGYVEEEVMADPSFFGFAAVIAKPYNTERLEEVIRQVMLPAKS